MERPPTSLLDVAPSSIRALFQNRLGLDVEAIEIPDIVAAYHEIYFITLSDGQEVVLRVARDGSCADKTEIEIATLQYIAKYTSAAIPKVLFWSSETSDLGYEYTVMTRLRGKILSHQLETLSPDALDSAIATLCDVHLELSSIPLPALAPAPSRDSAGGTPVTTADGTTSQQCVGTIRFARTASGEIHEDDYVLGPMLEETYWEPVEVDRWWTDTGATVEQLNPKGPYSHWKDYLAACFECYIWLLNNHKELEWARSQTPRLEALVSLIRSEEGARRFGGVQIEFDGRVTGILDREFASTYPSHLNPRSNFLHPIVESPAAEAVRAHTSAFVGTYLAKDSSDSSSSSSARTSTDIQSLDRTRAFLRAITEVCPRLQADRVLIAKGDWITALREKLDELGV